MYIGYLMSNRLQHTKALTQMQILFKSLPTRNNQIFTSVSDVTYLKHLSFEFAADAWQ